MAKIRRAINKFDRFVYSILYKYKTELVEIFLSTFLFLYGLLILFHYSSSYVFAPFLLSGLSVVLFALWAMLIGVVWSYGLYCDGTTKGCPLRRMASLASVAFCSFGLFAGLLTHSIAISVMLPGVITSSIIYLRRSMLLTEDW